MIEDNEFGNDRDLLGHINDAITTLNANRFEDKFTEEDIRNH